MAAEINAEFADRIENAYYVWFSTVRDDGMPQPTPVWFVRDGDTFLIYTSPDAQKLHNIDANANVALSYAPDVEAANYFVIMGTATRDADAPSPAANTAYIAKYAEGMAGIGMTPAAFDAAYPVAIRVTPTRVRME